MTDPRVAFILQVGIAFEDGLAKLRPLLIVVQIERALRIYDMGKNCGRSPVTIKVTPRRKLHPYLAQVLR